MPRPSATDIADAILAPGLLTLLAALVMVVVAIADPDLLEAAEPERPAALWIEA